jgi:hypothetical protein
MDDRPVLSKRVVLPLGNIGFHRAAITRVSSSIIGWTKTITSDMRAGLYLMATIGLPGMLMEENNAGSSLAPIHGGT